MKNRMKYIVMCLCMVLIVACQDHELAESKNVGVDINRPVQTTLSFGVPELRSVTVTRAGNSESDILSTGVRIYVFDMEGNYVGSQDINGSNLIDNKEDDEGHHYEAKNVTLYVGTQRVYALANITLSGYFENAADLLDELERSADEGGESRFLDTYYTLALSTSDNLTFPQFSGGYMPLSGVGDITVDAATGNADGIVRMKRLVAQIIFKVKTEYPIPNTNRKAVFTPQTYTFYNVPKQGFVLESEERTTVIPAEEAENFYNTEPEYFGVVSEETKQVSFERYVPESIRKKEQSCGSNYNNREAFEGQGSDKNWLYAPQYGMYVVLDGTYSETETSVNESGNEITTLKKYGNVSYTIHLGDFSEETGSLDNYSVERNNIYTYTVTVHGVDKIKVEAETETGDYQNGAEGDIIELDDASQVFNLDSHYEQVYVEFDLKKVVDLIKDAVTNEEHEGHVITDDRLKELIGGNFMLSFRSPFTKNDKVVRPFYDPDHPTYTKEEAMNGIDYSWVEFYPQQEAKTISLYPSDKSKLLDAWEVCHGMGDIVYQLYKNGSVSDDHGLDISDGEDKKVRFTVFINEYFYEHDLEGNTVGWKSFTNQEDRVMLIASDMKISTDLNSTYSTALTYISQASIETFYNSDDDNALGIETYNENGKINGFGNVYNISNQPTGGYVIWQGNKRIWIDVYNANFWMNGRANTICNISGESGDTDEDKVKLSGNLDWDYYRSSYGPNIDWSNVGYTEQNSSKGNKPFEGNDNYKAYNACLTRNRDLNGNGKIDENELRWYLPAISQYLRIGIGARALSADTRLYTGDKGAMSGSYPSDYLDDGSLYWTSNYCRNHYWAVEIGAYGSQSGSQAQIRCVRNLPKKSLIPKSGDAPVGNEALAEAIYGEVKTINEGENYLFDFEDRLVPSIFRPSSQPQQRPYVSHDEEDNANNLPNAFVVAKEYLLAEQGNGYWYDDLSNVLGENNQYTDPCRRYTEEDGAVGWRTPNLSELMIMAQAQATHSGINLLKTSTNSTIMTFCSTKFSNQRVRIGFVYNGELITAPSPGSTNRGYIRCVRDATQTERDAARVWSGN